MKLLTEKIKKADLASSQNFFGHEMVKGVVDIKKNLLAIDAEMHADIEHFLLSNGSNQYDLWGINLYPDEPGDDFVEFDSMINIRPAQNNRSRSVENPNIQKQILSVIDKWIEQ